MRLLPVLLLALVLAPTVAADHVYSHRYMVWGRVVDAEGRPVEGLRTNATLLGQPHPGGSGGCSPGSGPTTLPVTDAYGDFLWCFHTHESQGGGRYRLEAGGREVEGALDPDLRRTFVEVRLGGRAEDAGARVGSSQFATRYTLFVTAWEPGNVTLEGVPVRGRALPNHNLSALVTFNGDRTTELAKRTNAYGDAVFVFFLTEPLVNGVVTVRDDEGRFACGLLDDAHTSHLVLDPTKPTAECPAAPQLPSGAQTPAPPLLAALGLALLLRRRRA